MMRLAKRSQAASFIAGILSALLHRGAVQLNVLAIGSSVQL
jgi:hypothetical protein